MLVGAAVEPQFVKKVGQPESFVTLRKLSLHFSKTIQLLVYFCVFLRDQKIQTVLSVDLTLSTGL